MAHVVIECAHALRFIMQARKARKTMPKPQPGAGTAAEQLDLFSLVAP